MAVPSCSKKAGLSATDLRTGTANPSSARRVCPLGPVAYLTNSQAASAFDDASAITNPALLTTVARPSLPAGKAATSKLIPCAVYSGTAQCPMVVIAARSPRKMS